MVASAPYCAAPQLACRGPQCCIIVRVFVNVHLFEHSSALIRNLILIVLYIVSDWVRVYLRAYIILGGLQRLLLLSTSKYTDLKDEMN